MASGGGATKRARLSAADPYDHVEKQRQQLVGSDRNRMALKASNKLREYLDKMTDKELERYEHFRRSSFKHDTVKQLMLLTIQTTETKPVAEGEMKRISIIMAGITKMYVGSIVEEATRVMARRKESGPLQPHHVREAYRRLQAKGQLIHLQTGLSGY